tara:strand:+ start:2081 stop:3331 length:1251 start_codon:yes stop_codon:yes gene_type:complete
MKKFFLFFLIWLFTIVVASIYSYENPEKIDRVKNIFKEDKDPKLKGKDGEILRTPGNSFLLEFYKKIPITEKTAFIVHDDNFMEFDEKKLKIYYQNGYKDQNLTSERLNLPDIFTVARNGGVKTIFIYKEKEFAFISSLEQECFYASIVFLQNKKEIFKTKCLPKKNLDYNGLGSSHIHHNGNIFLTIGAPEQESSDIRKLAQSKKTMYGKIIQIESNDLDQIIEGTLSFIVPKIFSMGHRNPQGLTKINENFFSVEHGPKGGDELNKIIENKNYGWPEVSYGTQYNYDENGKAYEISHENNNFEEPLFALVPSVGISSVNNCPSILKNYYKKPCLLALSLYGNSLRSGRSIIIYLLNEKMDKVHSVEKIHLRKDLILRHFVTNSKNELYEDNEGSIYVSADKNGIYKLSFKYFRN